MGNRIFEEGNERRAMFLVCLFHDRVYIFLSFWEGALFFTLSSLLSTVLCVEDQTFVQGSKRNGTAKQNTDLPFSLSLAGSQAHLLLLLLVPFLCVFFLPQLGSGWWLWWWWC